MTGNDISIKGMYRDVLIDPDKGVTYDSGWHSNTIVQNCRVLIAGFMKNESPSGIQYLAVGRGKNEWDGQWNTANPPGPALDTVTALESQAVDSPIRVEPGAPVPGEEYLQIVYLDQADQPVFGQATNRLEVKATLKPGYPAPIEFNTYPLREFGLFGSFGGQPFMINCVRHPVIYKDLSATLVREIKLYF
ncbi:MAG: hypothetical protein A4E65_03732 [Syntrophorhabdus sp. PtaU1.Bin153]|nr:MAG: hypothetical protein A4E65_03732 [Syntrophorhabdus sp. PtaU1.Bin153]